VQHDDVAGSPAGKQRPDQLRGHRLVALWTLIPLQAVSERVCVGGREGARRGGWFSHRGVQNRSYGTQSAPAARYGSRLCENAPSRDLLRIFFLGRALTMMSKDFLAAVSPKSRPKFYFEKERPSFHTAWVKNRRIGRAASAAA